MIRVLFSIIFVVLILALGNCAQTAFHSHKAIGRSVALLLIGLIPPVIGNLVIISSTYKLGATIGSYIYFLGMDLAVYALLRFTFDYCSISWPNRALRVLVDALMILIDADNFKDVNDNFGHEVGDRVLQKLSGAIRRHFRVDDFVCRFGGDEFVVIIAHADNTLHDLICSKFALINEDLADTSDGLPPVSVSAGIAFGRDAADASALFEHADHALYESKHKGRCRFTFYDAAEAT